MRDWQKAERLACLRQRTLSNPRWPVDPGCVRRYVDPDLPDGFAGVELMLRPWLVETVRRLDAYRRLRRRGAEPEGAFAERRALAWRSLLDAVDDVLAEARRPRRTDVPPWS